MAKTSNSCAEVPEATSARVMAPNKEGPVWRKYSWYDIDVSPEQGYKAREIKLGGFGRPHMRAFHYAWFGFFIGKFVWFAISPIRPLIASDLNLSDDDIRVAQTVGFVAKALARIVSGPLCDAYGARITFSVMLCVGSIPAALIGTVQSLAGFCAVKVTVAILTGTLVSSLFWSSQMFTKEIVGTANGLVGGWADLGSGMSLLVVGSILVPWFHSMTGSDVAWRIVCVIPAVLAFATGILMYFYTDDSPRGNYFEIKKADPTFKTRSPLSYFRAAVGNFNTWILFAHYASSSGIEVAFTAAAIDYYRETFGMPTEAAVAIANMFFWLEFFARPLGGLVSDLANNRWGMRGRLWVQATNLLLEGAFIMIFAVCQSVSGSIVVLIFFSLLVKMTKGSTFAVVPYVSPPNTGSVTGCTGAGGKVGALAFTLLFSGVPHSFALTCMGIVVFASALLTAGVSIRGHRGMFSGLDRNVDPETGELIITGASGARSSTQVDRVSSSCT